MQQATLAVGTSTIAYLKQGTGPALVIVHGVGGHKEDWAAVAAAMATTYSLYAVDMLGFGGSSRDAAELGMTAQVAAIVALLDHEGHTVASLLGNSVGGWVAATFAATYPERTRRLVLVDPAGFEAMFQGEPPVNLFPDDVEQMAQLLSYVLHSSFAHTPDFAAQAFAAFVASGEKSIAPRLGPGLFQSARLETLLPRVEAPTLVVWGREDRLFPVALAPYIASLTTGATSHIIDHAGHFPQVDQPEVFVAVVAPFLNAS